MTEFATLAAMLQYGDSFFPSGSVAFSWGLESLVNEGKIQTAEALEEFIVRQLRYRWASCDRAFLAAAYHAGDDLDRIREADALLECFSLAQEFRTGSQRLGATLLQVHAKLDTPNAQAYRNLVQAKLAPGHIAIVQGLVGCSVRLTLEQTCLVAVHGFCVNLLSAAIRLSLIGHLDSQRLLTHLRRVITEVVQAPIIPITQASTYSAIADIAAMRHEVQFNRLFSN